MSNKTSDRLPIEKILLVALGVAGFLVFAAVAPGIAPVLKQFGVGKRRVYKQSNISAALRRLERKGFVKFVVENGKRAVVLTKSGEKRLNTYRSRNLVNIEKPPRWDGKWSIVAFDIEEEGKKLRDQLRYELSQVGFVRLQNSIWIYPYECGDFVQMLKVDRKLGSRVLYVRADSVENDSTLRQHFKLV